MKFSKKSSLKTVYRLIFIAVFVYIVTAIMLFFNKTSYIYFPDEKDFYDCSYFTDDEKIDQDGTRLYHRQNGKSLVVIYHGNAGRACDRTLYASYFDANNISYIIVEYAGYAGDKKRPSRKLILKDVDNAINFVKGLDYDELTILGESIGGGAAVQHMTLQSPDKLILISPFTKLSDIARIHYSFYPAWLLSDEEYNNIEPLSNYKGSLLLIHGQDDQIIPSSMSQRLYEISKETLQKELMIVPNAEHNDLLVHDEVFKKIISFLNINR